MKKSSFVLLVGVLLAIIGLMIGLRVVALDSDAYRGLSWDTGLFTDEGYYMHNARNVVLFGQAKTDEFNNMLLMPTLHYFQVGWFKAFGVGLIQTRAISVVFSLLTLVVFWFALNKAFDERVASLGALFLGLDHINTLYTRMGLMDTPAAFVMVCAFYAIVSCFCNVDRDDAQKKIRRWAILSGVALGLVYATRGLGAILIPAPFLAFWICKREDYRLEVEAGRIAGGMAVGLFGVLALYFAIWYLPNRTAMAHANHYHLTFQLAPHSVSHLVRNIGQAVSGQKFLGLAPYLSRYSPVQFALTLLLFGGWGFQRKLSHKARFAVLVSALWLLAGWGLFAVVNYAPSRYYALIYPAMATLSAVSLVYFNDVWESLMARRLARACIAGFLAYQWANMALMALHRETGFFALIVTALVAIYALFAPNDTGYAHDLPKEWGSASLILFVMWASINFGWYADWWRNLSYTHRDASLWLSQNLPSSSVLIGDCAPGLCVNNRFRCVNVIPDLCNDTETLSRWKGSPVYITILDDKWKEAWWTERYPKAVALENRLTLFARVVSHPVGVYRVNAVR